jgi:hypothetical protein
MRKWIENPRTNPYDPPDRTLISGSRRAAGAAVSKKINTSSDEGTAIRWDAYGYPLSAGPQWLGQFASLVDAQDKVERWLDTIEERP